MRISETYFASKNHFRIPKYSIYTANHTDDTTNGRTAILINSSIKHNELAKHNADYLQAVTLTIEDLHGLVAVCCPPKHKIKT